MHSAHLKLGGGGDREERTLYFICDRNDYPPGVPKHTFLFYLDKYRFVAGNPDLEQGESVRMLCFISKLLIIHCKSWRKNSVCQREEMALATMAYSYILRNMKAK